MDKEEGMGSPDSPDFRERMRYWDHRMANLLAIDTRITVAGVVAFGLLTLAILLKG